MAGAPFFFGEAEAVALGLGVSLGLGEAEADSCGEGVGVGEFLRFFFLLDGLGEDSGVGLGDDFFFFTEAEGLEDGVGLSVDFFFGDGDFSGDAVGFEVGDFSSVDFFFLCFRGVGVGVGAKIFFSSVPSDCAAGARVAVNPIAAITINAKAILIVRCIENVETAISWPARPAPLCSTECRLPDSRAGNSHSANERGNRAARVPSTTSRRQECRGTGRQSECCRLRG